MVQEIVRQQTDSEEWGIRKRKEICFRLINVGVWVGRSGGGWLCDCVCLLRLLLVSSICWPLTPSSGKFMSSHKTYILFRFHPEPPSVIPNPVALTPPPVILILAVTLSLPVWDATANADS